MSGFLRVLENEVQLICLAFLLIVYIIRIFWLLRFKSVKERTYPAGSSTVGIVYVQFVIFHVGVALAIGATFIIPYWPAVFEAKPIVIIFQIAMGAALVVGFYRLYRRIAMPAIRMISTVDDYFSLALMILYFAVAAWAIPNSYERNEWRLILFFALTAFFLLYVPFSKIGHYLYYPFTRFFLGRTLGHRGVGARKRQDRNPDKI
jgi:nitrate reductase gamma subunit